MHCIHKYLSAAGDSNLCLAARSLGVGISRQCFDIEGACLSLAKSACAERERSAGESHRICESRSARQKGPSVFLIH